MKYTKFKIILPLFILLTVVFLLVNNVFRYKGYNYSEYLVMFKDKEKIYLINNPMDIIEDRFTKEKYIEIMIPTHSFSYNLRQLFILDDSSYEIKESNSKFYDGIISFNNFDASHIQIDRVTEEISIRETIFKEKLTINYNNKTETIFLDPKKSDPNIKKTRYLYCSKRRNGSSCSSLLSYGISFNKLKDTFDLKLKIEVDKKNKIIYFIKE